MNLKTAISRLNNSYQQLLQKLLAVNLHGGCKLGLKNSLHLNTLLGNPVQQFPAIHVAGTNGKGSVVTKIAAALQSTGLRVGLYTSPHIACFRERIRINGEMISEEQVSSNLSRLFEMNEKYHIQATFFELTTLMAFNYFAEKNVDIAVIETGLGGRLDATNIVKTKLAAITSISLDHTEILGNTIEKITYEKAGIIKPETPVVVGPRVPHFIIEEIAKKQKCPYYPIHDTFHDFYAENEAIAQKALEILNVPSKAILHGLHFLPPCRLETFTSDQIPKELFGKELPPAVIMDVGHNPDGLIRLIDAVKSRFPNKNLRIILGLSKNKDIKSCLNILKHAAVHFHLVEAKNGRAEPKEGLKEYLVSLGFPAMSITCESSIESSVASAIEYAGKQDEVVVICGTFFIMADARKTLGIKEPQDPQDLNERF